MQWIELTSVDFPQAIKKAGGLCLLPIGCLERHGPHLPLGTDQIVADVVAKKASEIEPAVVFPTYYFGEIYEARHYPGTFSLPHSLLLQLLVATVDEIGRNGFTKILIVNGHGGNSSFLDSLGAEILQRQRPYMLYTFFLPQMEEEDAKQWIKIGSMSGGGHAAESESSMMMYLLPDAVRMGNLTPQDTGDALGRRQHLEGVKHPLWWYADYPTHLAGDPRAATASKGEFLIQAYVRRLTRAIRAVKADTLTPQLQKEFHEKVQNVMTSSA